MPNNRTLTLIFVVLVFLSFFCSQNAFSHSITFTPPYDRVKEWDHTTPGIADSKGRANKETGYLGVYANAFAGGSVAEAKQFVSFYAPEDCTVTVSARIKYIGGKADAFHASWSGIKAVWEIDGKQHEGYVERAFTVSTIVDKILGIVSLGADGGLLAQWPRLAQAVEILDKINTMAQWAQTLHDLESAGDVQTEDITFTFNAKKGGHEVGIGLKGGVSGLITGTAFVFVVGHVEYIKVEGLKYPNLVLQSISVDPKNPIEGDNATVDVVVENSGESKVPWANLRVTIGEESIEKKVTDIVPDKPQTVTFDCTVPHESTDIVALIDCTSAVRETDEHDNEKNVSLIVAKKPDLYVKDIVIDPTNPTVSEKATVKVIVGNKSETPVDNVQVGLSYQDSPAGYLQLAKLPGGGEETVPFAVVIKSLKSNRFEAQISSRVKDSNSTDNKLVKTFDFYQPNLVITECRLAPGSRAIGDSPVAIEVVVKNSGDVDAHDVEIVRGTDTVGMQAIPVIKKGESNTATFRFTMPPTFGRVSFVFRVDPNNKIRETDETDNTKQFTTDVDRSGFDWQVVELVITPAKPSLGDQVEVKARIKNNSSTKDRVSIVFSVDGANQKQLWTDYIEPDREISVGKSQFIWIASHGRHIVKVAIHQWGKNNIDDIDWSNNALGKEFYVNGTEQVKGVDVTISAGSFRYDGRKFIFTSANRGDTPTNVEMVLKEYQYRGETLISRDIDTQTAYLKAGEAREMYVSAPAHNAKFEIILDPHDRIRETNEDNNSAVLIVGEFKPQPHGGPSFYQPQKGGLEVTKFLYTEPLTVGESRIFSCEIRNNASKTIEDITAVVEFFNLDVKKTLPKYGYGWREIKIPHIPAQKPQIGNTRVLDVQYKAVYPGNFRLQTRLLVNNTQVAKAYTSFQIKGEQELTSSQRRDLDLTAQDIWIDNKTPTVGEVISGGFVVHNYSPVALKNVEWKVYSNANEVASDTINEIGAGASYTVNASSHADQEGTFTIKAIVDPEDKIPETNENNNTITSELTITSTSQSISLPKVDVAVISVTLSNAHIKVGQDTKVKAAVMNLGSDTVNAVPVAFLVGDLNFSIQVIDSLAPGESKTVTAPLIGLMGGTYSITVIADRRELIKEVNEQNNRGNTTLVVDRLIKWQ